MEHVFIGNTDVLKADDVSDEKYNPWNKVEYDYSLQTHPTFNRLREAGCRFWLMSEGEEKSVMEIARYSGLLVTSFKIKKIVVEGTHDVN